MKQTKMHEGKPTDAPQLAHEVDINPAERLRTDADTRLQAATAVLEMNSSAEPGTINTLDEVTASGGYTRNELPANGQGELDEINGRHRIKRIPPEDQVEGAGSLTIESTSSDGVDRRTVVISPDGIITGNKRTHAGGDDNLEAMSEGECMETANQVFAEVDRHNEENTERVMNRRENQAA